VQHFFSKTKIFDGEGMQLAFYIFRRFLNGLYPLSEAMQTVD